MRRRTLISNCGAIFAALAPAERGWAAMPVGHLSENENRADRRPLRAILVGGPQGGRTDRWAKAVALGVQNVLSPGEAIETYTVGGQDGVTGANRLQALVTPNGRTAAMLPGEVATAFLVGDPRVHFQPGDWIPIMAGLSDGILVLRGGLARLNAATPIRLAAASLESTDLAAFLAFEKLGVTTVPIFGVRGASAAARAFAAGEADAVLLTGEEIPADAASLAAVGGVSICSLGVMESSGDIRRDPQFFDLPTVDAVAARRGASPLSLPMEQAYRAVAAACLIDFMLVLPHLTSSASVALWRQAALAAVATPALEAASTASAIRLTATGAPAAISPLDPFPEAILALRQFLFARFGWRPS